MNNPLDPNRLHILVVDDAPSDLAKLKAVIERAGHAVSTAADGQAAINLMRDQAPDLVFMDIVMPVMDGFKAVRSINADPQLAPIPVILVSTKNQTVDVAWALRQGAKGLVGKPFTPSQILEQIARHAPKR